MNKMELGFSSHSYVLLLSQLVINILARCIQAAPALDPELMVVTLDDANDLTRCTVINFTQRKNRGSNSSKKPSHL